MTNGERTVYPERSVGGVLSEIKDEVKEFVQTRVDMLKSEMKDKVSAWKTAIPLIVVGLLLGLTAWFVLTAALIAIIAQAFYPSHFAYFFSFLIIGVIYALVATICASFAIRELRQRGMMPQRTIRVLKEDQIWIQTEARQQV